MSENVPIKCLVIDDEPQAREVIKRYIDQVPLLTLAGESANAIEAMHWLQAKTVDLIFLDIHMPQMKGTDFLKLLKHPPKVILTTAHPDYALEGYELDVIDYLLKPITFDRFLKAVQKAIHYVSIPAETQSPSMPAIKKEPYVYFRADRKMVKVLLDDIYYIESMKDYIKIVTTEGTLVTKQSMSSVEAMLPEDQFLRTHRSFIVSMRKIRSYNNELIDVEKTEIPIGKLYRSAVLSMLA
jgi:DNA-binding LytR/AlgR family response regulator